MRSHGENTPAFISVFYTDTEEFSEIIVSSAEKSFPFGSFFIQDIPFFQRNENIRTP